MSKLYEWIRFLEVNDVKNIESKLEVYNLKTEQNNFLISKKGIIVLDSGVINKD